MVHPTETCIQTFASHVHDAALRAGLTPQEADIRSNRATNALLSLLPIYDNPEARRLTALYEARIAELESQLLPPDSPADWHPATAKIYARMRLGSW